MSIVGLPGAIDQLRTMLEKTGFKVSVYLDVRKEISSLPAIITEAKYRDIPQLNLITRDEYEEGLRKMASTAQSMEKLEGDLACLTVTCEKSTA